MAFRTITARFAGTCRRCGGGFGAGERIRFGGRGRTYHFAKECGGGGSTGGGSFGRYETRGRCEDAPCCGHSECGFGPGSPGYGSYVGGSPYYGEDREW